MSSQKQHNLSINMKKWFQLAIISILTSGIFISVPVSASNKVASKPVEPFYKAVTEDLPEVYEPEITYLSPEKEAPIQFTSLGATWDQTTPVGTNVHLEVRFKREGKYSDWYELEQELDEKYPNAINSGVSAFLTTNLADGYQYRISLESENPLVTPVLENLKLTFINGGSPGDRTELLVASQNQKNGNYSEAIPDDFDASLYTKKPLVKSTSLSAQAESVLVLPQTVKSTIKKPTVNISKIPVPKTNSNLNIISRADWGADESLRISSPETHKEAILVKFEDDYYTKYADELKESLRIETDTNGNELTWPLSYPEDIKKIVIHHTASARNLEDPKQAIRDIYVWHTLTKGWGDIGYNYIIDQKGNIYEGRYGGEMVAGAHAGRGNFGSIGIAVLGNFQDSEPPEAVVSSLTALIKEKAELYNIDTEGASLFRGEKYPNVMGHRDIMTTACPGEKLYDMLPTIRKLAKAQTTTVGAGKVKSQYEFGWASNAAPVITLNPNGKKMTSFTVKNNGTGNWGPETYFKIAHNKSSQTLLRNYQQIFTSTVGKTIKPGESVELRVLLNAGSTSGSALIDLQPVIDGKYSQDKYLSLALKVSAPPPTLKYDYVFSSIIYSTNQFKKGDIVEVTVKLRNKGASLWQNTGANKLTLGADKPRDHKNQLLTNPSPRLADMKESLVRPGELATFVFKIKVPEKDGIYKEYFTPVVEGVQWMENRNSFIQLKVGNSDQIITAEEEETIPVITTPAAPKTTTTVSPTPTGSSTTNIAGTALVVTSRPRDIRIDLAYRGNPAVISADGAFALYEGKRKLTDYVANQKVSVKYENGQFTLSTNGATSTMGTRPRFVPSTGTIMRVDNWERRNTWGDKANNNEFRGTLEVLIYEDELHVVNELPLEDYLKGIAEESSTAPDEKIKTIMVIARTYARFYMDVAKKFPGAPFDLNDDPNYSQKYLGYSFEKRSPKTARLAAETAGKYVTYQGKLIKTPYFSKSDGKKTISAKEKWGWTDTPFLISVDDSHCDSTAFSGHGVGLSGCGATALANQGKSYKEIIQYYYQGAEIVQALY